MALPLRFYSKAQEAVAAAAAFAAASGTAGLSTAQLDGLAAGAIVQFMGGAFLLLLALFLAAYTHAHAPGALPRWRLPLGRR